MFGRMLVRSVTAVFAGSVLLVAAAAQKLTPKIGLFQPAERANPVTYDISAQLVFTPPVGTKAAHVWLVKPPDDAGQELLEFETDPKPTLEAPDPLYGNQLFTSAWTTPTALKSSATG